MIIYIIAAMSIAIVIVIMVVIIVVIIVIIAMTSIIGAIVALAVPVFAACDRQMWGRIRIMFSCHCLITVACSLITTGPRLNHLLGALNPNEAF